MPTPPTAPTVPTAPHAPTAPTATPNPWNVQVTSPWAQAYNLAPTPCVWEVTNGTNTCVLPQVWTSATSTVYNYQYYVTDQTLTMVIPQELGHVQHNGWQNLPMGSGYMNTPRREAAQMCEPPVFGTRPFIEETPVQTAARMRREQQAAHEAAHEAEAERQARAEARRQERAEADGRAEALLQMFLSPEQAEEYARQQTITVTAPSGRRYRLRRMLTGGVQELDEQGNVRATLCIQPIDDCPTADMLVCQLHMIANREDEFRAIANHRRVA